MKTLTRIGAAAALVLGGIVASSVPAQAVTYPTDCFPASSVTNPSEATCDAGGWYYSEGSGAKAHGRIRWVTGQNLIQITTDIRDVSADGFAPRLKIVYSVLDQPQKTKVLHAGDTGTNFVVDNGPDSFDGITIYMCNGGNDTTPSRCSAAHGPFHNY